MEPSSVFFMLAIVIVVLLFITQPFYRTGSPSSNEKQYFDALDETPEEYQTVIRNIRELTADFEQGKLSESDYSAQRQLLEAQGIQLLEQQKMVKKISLPKKQNVDREIEEMIHKRRKVREEQTAGFCPKCGKPVQKSDQFCPSCGEPTHLYL
jgi:rubrerythrin